MAPPSRKHVGCWVSRFDTFDGTDLGGRQRGGNEMSNQPSEKIGKKFATVCSERLETLHVSEVENQVHRPLMPCIETSLRQEHNFK